MVCNNKQEIFSYIDNETFTRLTETNNEIRKSNQHCSKSKIIKIALKELLNNNSTDEINKLIACDMYN